MTAPPADKRSGCAPGPVKVRWRGTSRPCGQCGAQHLSFDLADGSVLRLRLTAADARSVIETLAEMIALGQHHSVVCRKCGCQSASSHGNPQVAQSGPAEGENT